MGCVQARPSAPSPSRGLHKMKLDHGYVPARGARGRGRGELPRQSSRRSSAAAAAAAKERRGEEGEERRRARSAERGGNRGGDRKVEERAEPVVEGRREVRNGDGEELVDGWPRWLVENVKREVLAGLVPRSADSYDKLDKVGQGTYSNVYKARDRETGKIVALKKVRFDTSEPESVKFMAREIMILQKLDHPNVIKLEGLATSRMQYSLYLVFDFMQSDLARVISRPDENLTEPQVKCYMHQLLAGLQHCHERGILHRDIKGSNLLIDKHGMLKIADFGLANYFNPNKRQLLTSRVVTLWYRAPELLLGTTDYGVGIDLWSAGCLLAEMFAGRPIMPGRTEVEQLHKIFKLCGSPSEDYWIKLKLSTSFRPPHPYKSSILEAFRDFPSSSMGLLATLLALDPSNRGSAASALNNEFFTTSPLACDLSGLPVMYKEETDDTMQLCERRRRKTSRRRSRTQKEGREVEGTLKPNGDSVTSKEEKISVRKAYSQELGSSAGSTSSSMKPKMFSVSPSPSSIPETSHSRKIASESHPSATSNIKNLPLPPSDEAAGNDNMQRRRQSHHRSLEKRSSSASGFRRSEGKPKRYIAG